MILSANIKKYREDHHFSQEELASQMMISRQSISKWERGESLPSIENLVLLSELLEISLDQLIKDTEDLPLPFEYGRKPKWLFWAWMILPMMMLFSGIVASTFEESVTYFLMGFFFTLMIDFVGFVDLRQCYNYFTVDRKGIEYYDKKGFYPRVFRELAAMFNIRPTKFVAYSDIDKMAIYFNNQGYEGQNTTVAYRPRQSFINREEFLLLVHTKEGDVIELNLDRAFFSQSEERRYFCGMFKYFESKGIEITDKYHILDSIENERDLIKEAYKLKEAK